MSIFKDWKDNNAGYVFRYKVINLLSPKEWLRLHKWRKQRADRGWSDRDMWAAGEYVARLTADMVEDLSTGHTDWEWWFNNTKKKESYDNLTDVVADIRSYLDYESNTNWTDGLKLEGGRGVGEDGFWNTGNWVDEKTGKTLTDKQIRTRIIKHANEGNRIYKKATKAMEFFGRNFAGFWD